MSHLLRWAGALALVLLPSLASAQQSTTSLAQSGSISPSVPCALKTDGTCAPVSASNPLPTISAQESIQLASANTPLAATMVMGGDYILSQTCSGYGTLALQALGPDGTTWQTLLSKTASDTAGGSGLALGSYAKVRVTVTGTSGCYAILARVPS